ncbi:DUF2267 domain-containing protein [Siculibacillus lacustris]|nr:DUF2267 domain-containing protein [Siculibacillus lacustris]
MPIPRDYVFATPDFERFLGDLEETSLLASHSNAYAEARAVFHVFRRHATPAQALAFAAVLPPLLKAMFLEDWDIEAPIAAFPDDDAGLAAEFATEQVVRDAAAAIADVAATLRRHVDRVALDRVLAALPEGARAYWRA